MMKRKYAAAMMMAVAVALAAAGCSKPAEPASEAATTEAVTEETSKEETTEAETTAEEAEQEEEYVDGIVTDMDGSTMTIDSGEGEELTFDYSNAAVNSDYELGVGDEVSITFYLDEAADMQEATVIDVLYSVAEENAEGDPVLTGVVEDASTNTIAVKDEMSGEVRYFTTMIAQKVTGDGGIAVGDEVQVTYLGEVGDQEYPGLAVKVVTSDMYDSDEAKINTLTGVAAAVEDGRLDMETEDGNIFNFISEGADLSSVSEGDTVTVIYEGSLGEREIPAVGLQ